MSGKLTVSVCAVGDEKVGKSQLLLRFAQQPFGSYPRFDNYERDFSVYGQQVKIRALDTASQDSYVKLRQLLYASTDVFLLCCPCDDAGALANLEKRWFEELKKANHSKTPLILVLTKCDRRKDDGLDRAVLLNVDKVAHAASKMKVADFFECSAKTGDNVEAIFKRAAELVIRRRKYDGRTCLIL
ncbi:putative ras similarity family [Fasciola hepatica]|uniref:Ras similarity family n=1 Tax=Fasciola hepatica TaxID=6192 RepID=A0A4E0S1P4_FASHE|nr:putative ras similarity family [Fasciola hepatica]